MNAVEFIKKFGWETSKDVVVKSPLDSELFNGGVYIKNCFSEGKVDYFLRWSDGFNNWVEATDSHNFIDDAVCIDNLKRLVESYELVNSVQVLGRTGYDEVKSHLNHCDPKWCHFHSKKWKDVIKDVEKCNESN